MKNIIKLSLLMLVASAFAIDQAQAGTVPPGWKTVKDNGEGKCQMAIPADWKLDMFMGKPMGSAHSPNEKSSAVVNGVELSFNMSKEVIGESFEVEKMIENSSTKHYFKYRSHGANASNLNLYIGIKNGSGTCNAQISVPEDQDEIGKKIAASVGPSR